MNWTVEPDVSEMLPDMETARNLDGEVINANWMSSLLRVQAPGSAAYYVKRYTSAGRGLRRFIGRSRVRAEWENLLFFEANGLPTARVVAYGESRSNGYFGVLVTEEVRETRDLAALAEESSSLLADRQWRLDVIDRLSETVRRMHALGFVHTDLKWRNILVETGRDPRVFLIDCPLGRCMWGPFLSRGRIKDIACLDKVGRQTLSRSDRLRFYLHYRRASRLTLAHKQEIRRILTFFSGRE